MASLLLVLPLSALFWFFSVVALSGAIAVFALSVARIIVSVRDCQKLVGALLAGTIMIWMSIIVGWGAYGMGSHVMDSLIARLS